MSKHVLREYPSTEATRDPVFLLETRQNRQLKDGSSVGCWVVDYGHGIWFTRVEAENYAMMRHYHYGNKGEDWRVYCCCSEGRLATLLEQHRMNDNQQDEASAWSLLQHAILAVYEDGEFSHHTPATLEDCGDGLLRFLMSECSPGDDCSTVEVMRNRIETAIRQLDGVLDGINRVQCFG